MPWIGTLKCYALVSSDKWNTINFTGNLAGTTFAGVAELNNKVFVSGGSHSYYGHPKTSVKSYDPDTNTWSYVAKMNNARLGHCLIGLNGRLYAIGGQNVDSVEVYDPDNNTWTLQQNKLDGKVASSRGGACLIKKYMCESNIGNCIVWHTKEKLIPAVFSLIH